MTPAALILLAAANLASVNCAAIPDPDQAAYCRALEAGSVARCVEIRDYATRQRCRVELGDNSAGCATIPNMGEREMCRARAK